ncbi:MAG: PhzF family phenazine biosynthesis protein [Acidimicrobiales bacterium]
MQRVSLKFVHLDVFASSPYHGNSVAVVHDTCGLSREQMLVVTRELRHFETIFVRARRGDGTPPGETEVRVFDLFEELAFAGHPTLGAAVALARDSTAETTTLTLRYRDKAVPVTVEPRRSGWHAVLDAGRPAPFVPLPATERAQVAAAFGLTPDDLCTDLPMEIGSTGLRYLVVPVAARLAEAAVHTDLTPMLERLGADFAYLVDVEAVEGRHWNNDGVVEDVATGSAAGVAGAYLVRHGRAAPGRPIELSQGRFVGRPSRIRVTVDGSPDRPERVRVGGEVQVIATGHIVQLPDRAEA